MTVNVFNKEGTGMGMESFRLQICWKKDVCESTVISCIAKHFSVEPDYYVKRAFFFTKKVYTPAYRVQDFIIASCYEPTKMLYLEACISNYMKYIRIMYDIFKCLYLEFGAEMELTKDVWIKEIMDYSSFERCVIDCKRNKIELFQSKYRMENVDMRPGSEFYRYIRQTNCCK